MYTFIFDALEPITWQAGQSIRIVLPAGLGTEERRFTISSAPYERHIAITTRVSSSDFKQALAGLQSGQEIDAYDIRGDFIWDDNLEDVLLCASGVGITPFMAMLRQRLHAGMGIGATLLYAHSAARRLFVEELIRIGRQDAAFTFVPIADRRINDTDVYPHISAGRIYLAGPSGMVTELADSLLARGVSQDRLRSDWFTGRTGWEK